MPLLLVWIDDAVVGTKYLCLGFCAKGSGEPKYLCLGF
jgi:hypothetical protein